MSNRAGIEEAGRKSTRGFSWVTLAQVGAWVVLIPIYLMFVASASTLKESATFIDLSVFSGAILCASFKRSRIGYMVAAAIPLFVLAEWLRTPPMSAAFMTLGCGGAIVLAYEAAGGSRLAKQYFQIAILLPLFVVLTNVVNRGVVHLTPHLYDAALLRADPGIGAAVRGWTLARPMRLAVVNIFYGALPLPASLVIAYTTERSRSQLLRASCYAALLALPLYVLIPAVGPAHIGQPGAFRNCVPSLHVTWAALFWLNAHPAWLRHLVFVFMLVTAFTTLATGEHYVLDLVVAVPFTWMVQKLGEPGARLSPAVGK